MHIIYTLTQMPVSVVIKALKWERLGKTGMTILSLNAEEFLTQAFTTHDFPKRMNSPYKQQI